MLKGGKTVQNNGERQKCKQYIQIIFRGKLKTRQAKVKNVLGQSIKKPNY